LNASAPSGCMAIWDGFLLHATQDVNTRDHLSWSAALVVGYEKPITVTITGQPPQVCEAVLIDANIERSTAAEDGFFIGLHADLLHRYGQSLRRRLAGTSLLALPRADFLHLRESAEAFARGELDCAQVQSLYLGLIRAAGAAPGPERAPDPVIATVMQQLERERPVRIDVPALARQVGLSTSGLSHRFKRQTGLSLSRYLLWRKLRHAARRFRPGISLTELAQDAGFSDSAHLSRSVVAVFGRLPSWLASPDLQTVIHCGEPAARSPAVDLTTAGSKPA